MLPEPSDPFNELYDANYFLSCCGGFREFAERHGESLIPRLQRALELGAPKIDERILDLGCGRGELAYHLSKRGIQVTVLDLSFEALRIASTLSQKNGHNDKPFQLINADCMSLPFGENQFHLIFLTDVIEHLPSSRVKTVLSEIKRILRPGGRLIIHTVPNNLYLNVGYPFLRRVLRFGNGIKLAKEVRTPQEKLRHVNEQNVYKLRRMLRLAGFDYNIQFEEGCLDSPYLEPFFKTKIGRLVERLAKSRILKPFFTIGLYACATPKSKVL
ncbi:MAG: class I SAM-dependent methyltransferase [Candidatus Tectomicrobia bacterium]|uniref:Class I SAM-dependent methyltransferase n=1 Tax=Tectimicrobiota bacterium TaxID=2528274 RepID=A0A933GLA4_UNCTE|nr:class I SAM-dependent methyltransferase [Candidatus Tectomicrobia bacterium]